MSQKGPRWLWMGWVLAAAALAVCFPVSDTDLWWHLAAGRWILGEGRVPQSEFLTTGSLGRPWFDVHWLFQCAVALIHAQAGLAGVVAAKCAVFALGAALLVRTAELEAGQKARGPIALVVLLFLVGARGWAFERPVIVSLLFMAAFLYLLERYLREPRRRFLFALAAIQVIWANTQPLFPLGPVLAGGYLAGELLARGARRLGGKAIPVRLSDGALLGLLFGWLGLCLACLITPYGAHPLRIALLLLGRLDPLSGSVFSRSIAENLPLWTLERMGDADAWPIKYLAALSFASFGLAPGRPCPGRWLVLSGIFVTALLANRNALLLCWVAAPYTAMHLGAFLDERPGPRLAWAAHPALAWLPPGCAWLALLAWTGSEGLAMQPSLGEPLPFRVPTESAPVLRALAPGRIFNADRYGGYLSFALFPERRPFIDGRFVQKTAAELSAYLEVLDRPERFDGYAEIQGFTYALIPVAMPDRYQRLAARLLTHPGWKLLSTDGTELLFGRSALPVGSVRLSDPAELGAIRGRLDRRFGRASVARQTAELHLGLALLLAGAPARAQEILAPLRDTRARAILARADFLAGEPGSARARALALLQEIPGDPASLGLLARIALSGGEPKQAAAYAAAALRTDPFATEAREILEAIGGARGYSSPGTK